MAQLRLALAALLLLVLQLAAATREGPRPLPCPPSVVSSVVSCSDTGSVMAGGNVTYSFSAEAGGRADLVFSLHTSSGDADLLVVAPSGAQHSSKHGSGEDVVFIPRASADPGQYLVTVLGSSELSSYKLSVESHQRQRSLAATDRAVLSQLLAGPCCARPGSCPTLKTALGVLPAPSQGQSGTDTAGSQSSSSSSGEGGDGSSGGGSSGGSGPDLCSMGRNLCDVDGHLEHLALVNEYMTCPFPSLFRDLPSLTSLDVTMNDFTGRLETDVAPVVAGLPKLQHLLLGHNRLGGSLSCDLMGPSLAELDVTANQLEGTIPACLVESPAIQELYLSNNRLEGTLPQPPAGSRLLIISAHSNHLSGSLPEVSSLPQLEALVLSSNNFTGGLVELPESVRHINLDGNSLSGSIAEQWASLPSLEVVRMRKNQLSGSLPAGLAQKEELQLLLLGGNRLSGSLPDSWSAPKLQRLEVAGNELTGTLPASLGALPSLAVLQAGNNLLSGGLDAFVQAAAAADTSSLQVLSLPSNQLTGSLPPELAQLPVLDRGGYTLLDGASVPATLDLSGNQLSGAFPAWLVGALGSSNAAVNLAGGNTLTCPEELVLPSYLFVSRLLNLECVNTDGKRLPVAALVRVGAPPPEAQQPQEAGPEEEEAAGEEQEEGAGGEWDEGEGQEAEEEQQQAAAEAQQQKEQQQEGKQAPSPAQAAAPSAAQGQAGEPALAPSPAASQQQPAGSGTQQQAPAPKPAASKQQEAGPAGPPDGGSRSTDSATAAAGGGGGSGSGQAEGGHSLAGPLVVGACLVAFAVWAGPRLMRAVQAASSSRSTRRYQPAPWHQPADSLPLASPGMWAKEQQLALLNPSQGTHLRLPHKQPPPTASSSSPSGGSAGRAAEAGPARRAGGTGATGRAEEAEEWLISSGSHPQPGSQPGPDLV